MNVGRQLAEARNNAGLSQRELAHRAGVPLSTIGRIERGTVSPTVQTLERLAEAPGGRASFGFATSLLELVRLERDLSELLGVDVDVVPRSAMAEGMRRAADAEAVPV